MLILAFPRALMVMPGFSLIHWAKFEASEGLQQHCCFTCSRASRAVSEPKLAVVSTADLVICHDEASRFPGSDRSVSVFIMVNTMSKTIIPFKEKIVLLRQRWIF